MIISDKPIDYERKHTYHKDDAILTNEGGALERLIHETGATIIGEQIENISTIRFYSLTDEEERLVFSQLAKRMRLKHSPAAYTHSDCKPDFGPMFAIPSTQGTAGYRYDIIAQCYERAGEPENIKDLAKEANKSGYAAIAKNILKKIYPEIEKEIVQKMSESIE